MGLIEKWNNLAKKKIFINDSFEIPIGRLAYVIILNLFIMTGMFLSGGTTASVAWLWVDMLTSLRSKSDDDKSQG